MLSSRRVRVCAAVMSRTVQEMNLIHDTTPSAAAAAGRTLIASALIGSMLKNDTDSVTCSITSDGEINRITAVSDAQAQVKCEVMNPYTSTALNDQHKIDVKSIVGKGTLTVSKDLGYSRPYTAQTELVSGEIAEDFAHYFLVSEQIPSAVSLGVFVNTDLEVTHARGFIVQLMPGYDEETADCLEDKVRSMPPVTQLLRDGGDAYAVIKELFRDFDDYEITKTLSPSYRCSCSRHKAEQIILSLGEDEIISIIEDEIDDVEMKCHFCTNTYRFSKDHLRNLLNETTKL